MIFLDSSLLVKAYLPESDSALVIDAVGRERRIAVSELARAEMCSAVQRRRRRGVLSDLDSAALLRRLGEDWDAYERLPVTPEVLDGAIELMGRHALRTLDAIQLASALLTSRNARTAVRFGTADARLSAAAAAEGLFPLLGGA